MKKVKRSSRKRMLNRRRGFYDHGHTPSMRFLPLRILRMLGL